MLSCVDPDDSGDDTGLCVGFSAITTGGASKPCGSMYHVSSSKVGCSVLIPPQLQNLELPKLPWQKKRAHAKEGRLA